MINFWYLYVKFWDFINLVTLMQEYLSFDFTPKGFYEEVITDFNKVSSFWLMIHSIDVDINIFNGR